MDFITTLKKGAAAAVSSYKLLITIWLITLLMLLLVAVPLKSALKSIFGDSLSVERLKDGFDIGLTGDMGESFGQLMSSATDRRTLAVVGRISPVYLFCRGSLHPVHNCLGRIETGRIHEGISTQFCAFPGDSTVDVPDHWCLHGSDHWHPVRDYAGILGRFIAAVRSH